jgi:hypothetical protein
MVRQQTTTKTWSMRPGFFPCLRTIRELVNSGGELWGALVKNAKHPAGRALVCDHWIDMEAPLRLRRWN